MSPSTELNALLQRTKTVFIRVCLEAGVLLRRIGFHPQHPNEGTSTDVWITAVHMHVVVVLAVVGVASGLFTLTTTSGDWVVVLASMITLLLSPYLILQKQVLTNLASLRRRQHEMAQRIDEVHVTNQLLIQSIATLEPQLQSLGLVEGDLNQIAEEANVDKDHLIRVVEETGRLQKLLRQQLQAQIIQEVMTTVIASSESSQNLSLSENDATTLLSRLANLSHVLRIDEDKFRNLLLQDDDAGDMKTIHVTKLLRNLMDDSLPQDQRIIQVSLQP